MGADDICKYLESIYPKYANIYMLVDNLQIQMSSISRSLKSIERREEIEWVMKLNKKKISGRKFIKSYRIKKED